MSFALVSEQSKASTGKGKAASKASADALRIAGPDDAFEREAHQVAAETMSPREPSLGWSVSKANPEPNLRRYAPLVVSEVLRSSGTPLNPAAREFFERRIGHDFSRVRIHHDEKSAGSARAVGAMAYTLGDDVVFGGGRYRPETEAGQRLIAHELTHVIQQRGTNSAVLQRQTDPDQESSGGESMWSRAFTLADQSRWQQVAELVNGFSPKDLQSFLFTYKGQPDKVAYLYLGAIGNKSVGPDSAVAHATRVTYLDFNFGEESRKGNWPRAAFFVNGFSPEDTKARLAKLDSEKLKALHEGAVDNPELGVDSGAAKVSAAILAGRSAKGDTKALLLPTVKGEGKDDLLKVMRVVDSMQPSPVKPGFFIMTVDGQPENLTAAQAADVKKRAAGVLKDHLRGIQSKASMAVNAYKSQSEVDREHWLIAPIVKTLGRVKDPGPDLLAYGVRAQADLEGAYAAINAGNLTQAATLMASSEASAISASKMWQAYFQGIIGAGEMTVTVLEITRDAAFISLGILATIATGGAAAGALGAAEGTAAGATTAFGVSTATAANVIAVGAPIVANVAEAGAKVAMGDKVDWGALVIDTAVQIVIARFGGEVTGKLAKALLGNPATESLATRVTEKVVHTAIMHVGSTALMTAAQDTYRALSGQGVTWQTFVHEMIDRLTDPKSLAVLAVTGALTSAAEAKFGGPGRSTAGSERSASHQQGSPARMSTPTPSSAKPTANEQPPATRTSGGGVANGHHEPLTPSKEVPQSAARLATNSESATGASPTPETQSAATLSPDGVNTAVSGLSPDTSLPTQPTGVEQTEQVATPKAAGVGVKGSKQARTRAPKMSPSGLELETGTPSTHASDYGERDLGPQTPSGLELETGTPSTHASDYGERDLGPQTPSGLELETGTPSTHASDYGERDLGPQTPSGLELETGTPSTHASDYEERDLGSQVPSQLELATGPQPVRDVPFNERDLGSDPPGEPLEVYKGKNPLNKIPGVRQRKPTFGEASAEKAGTLNRTGTSFHEFNAAEIAQGLRVDYDPVAGRPRSVSYRVDGSVRTASPVTARAFSADRTVEGAQSRDSAYEHSGFDRGHLAQREAFKGTIETEAAVDQFTNVVPMTEALNRGPGSPWRASEEQTMEWAATYGSVNVKVEPIYDAQPKARLRDGTPVPKAIRRTISAPDGTLLQDVSFLNQ